LCTIVKSTYEAYFLKNNCPCNDGFLSVGCKKSQRTDNYLNDLVKIAENNDSSKRVFIGSEYAKLELEGFLRDSTTNLFRGKVLINSKEELILFAEPLLFKIYGKENIVSERPYEIYLFGDNWIMMGTLPAGWLGGTFSIAINRKTCEVLGITHGK
jgi:hypothetical protein